MATLSITVPCATDLVPLTYSYCLVYSYGTDTYELSCDNLCNPTSLIVSNLCCSSYEILNQSFGFNPVQISWVNCCSGQVQTAFVYTSLVVCSREYPQIIGYPFGQDGSVNISYQDICNCDQESDYWP